MLNVTTSPGFSSPLAGGVGAVDRDELDIDGSVGMVLVVEDWSRHRAARQVELVERAGSR